MPVLGRKYREQGQEVEDAEQAALDYNDVNEVESGLNINKKTVKSRLVSAKPGVAKAKPAAMISQAGALETSQSGEDGTWLTAAQVQEPQIIYHGQPHAPSASQLSNYQQQTQLQYQNMLQQMNISDERQTGYPQPKLYDYHYINRYAYPKGLKCGGLQPTKEAPAGRKTKSLYEMKQPKNRRGFSGWKLTRRPLENPHPENREDMHKLEPLGIFQR